MNIQLPTPDIKHFVSWCLNHGGRISETIVTDNPTDPMFPAFCNPSIFYDKKSDKFLMNLRNVSYLLQSSKQDKWGGWGPLCYNIPSSRFNWLETENYYGEVVDPIKDRWKFKKVEMKPRQQQWEFHGLEDIRIYRNLPSDTIYSIGVRRDDNPTGIGRMNAMTMDENHNESTSIKIKAPCNDTAYCIKNQSIITDGDHLLIDTFNPLHIIRWENNGNVSTVVKKPKIDGPDRAFDMLRGSSQTIPWKDGHLTIVHTCTMFYTANGRKYARYLQFFLYYDKDWNLVKFSPMFSFNNMLVEFCCGLTQKGDNLYISFALQDNCSYVLEVPSEALEKFLFEDVTDIYDTSIWGDNPDRTTLYQYALRMYNEHKISCAFTWFMYIVDNFPDIYNEWFMAGRCVADLGKRDQAEIGMWYQCMMHDRERPEAYFAIAMYYYCRGSYPEAKYWVEEGMKRQFNNPSNFYYSYLDMEKIYHQCMWQTSDYERVNTEQKQDVKAF